MMSTKFLGVQSVRIGGKRRLASPLTKVQKLYLTALGLSEKVFLTPHPAPG